MADQDELTFHQKPRETGPLLFLSLFLLLLAFFILLNALSTFEERKTRAVISSVAATFQTDTEQVSSAQILISTLGPVPLPQEVLEDVERLWVTAVPLARIDRLTDGRLLELAVPLTELFVGGEAAVRLDRDDLMRATAQALAAKPVGFVTHLRIALPAPDLTAVRDRPTGLTSEGAAEAPVDIDDPGAALAARPVLGSEHLPFARAGEIARTLVAAGAPPDTISVGLRHDTGTRLRLRFDILAEDAAQVTFRPYRRLGDGDTGGDGAGDRGRGSAQP